MDDLISRRKAIDAMGKTKWAKERLMELPSVQPDHVADTGRKVEQTGETAQSVQDEDLISREAAIEALARMMPRSYTPDGSHPADEEIFQAQEIFADCIEALEILPSAQPELIEKAAYIRGFEQGRTQGMVDSQGGKKCIKQRKVLITITYNEMGIIIDTKAEEVGQPDHTADISKKVDRDCISRKAVVKFFNDWISCLDENCHHQSVADMTIIKNDFKNLPSVQPERKKGHWLRYGEDGYPNNEDTVFWQCDQCLEQYTGRTKRIPNFCPNCGADMRGGGE